MPKGKAQPRKKGGGKKKSSGLLGRLKRATIGDFGALLADSWEGIGSLTGFNQEIKRLDVNVPIGVTTYAGAVTSLSLIAEGSDYNQRDGHSIKALGVEVRAEALYNAAAGSNFFRFILFLDLEQQGVQPTPAQVLEAVGVASAPQSVMQHDNTERFLVLWDWFGGVSVGGPSILAHTVKIPLGSHIKYSTANANDAAAREGHLYMLIVGDQAVNGPTLGHQSRLSYIDN